MFDQVLKFGSYIVDGLHEYKQPILVYIPPNGELRGGAWVVVDPTINQQYMEMYADQESRGGVLEPEGTVDIKFRFKDLSKTMQRLDAKCRTLKEQMASPEISQTQILQLEKEMKIRQAELKSVYLQVAVVFADLHDRAERMVEKGVITVSYSSKSFLDL